jgi:hypothetical protein
MEGHPLVYHTPSFGLVLAQPLEFGLGNLTVADQALCKNSAMLMMKTLSEF